MLKIKDSSGQTVAVLKDEDSSPEVTEAGMSKSQDKRLAIQMKEEEEDGDTDNGNV